MPRRHEPRDARRGAAGHERRPPAVANLAYGIHSVRVLLQRSPQRVRQVWLASSRDAAARLQELRSLAQQAQIRSSMPTTPSSTSWPTASATRA